MTIGFFMILVDTTIVSVANPAIKAALDPNTSNLDNVVWVTNSIQMMPASAAGSAMTMTNGSDHDWKLTTIRR